MRPKKLFSLLHRTTMSVVKTCLPRLWVKVNYCKIYKKKCNYNNPESFSEKLIWLRFNDYSNNKTIYELSDKYLVREYVKKKGCGDLLNQLYFKTESIDEINYDSLPESFVLKRSMGWNTNLICNDKKKLSRSELVKVLNRWDKGQQLYDIEVSKMFGNAVKNRRKYYICEKNLCSESGRIPSDYKIYCFYGEPKAILYITGRDVNKAGCFMSLDWKKISDLTSNYSKLTEVSAKPKSLDQMITAAKKLSKGFPFVRVDFYDYQDKAVFGEMTFFPAGCIGMQETEINGKGMTDFLPINLKGRNITYD